MKECEICTRVNLQRYVDGKTQRGTWADMCMPCHDRIGVGLGTGKGQEYAWVNGAYVKVAG